MPLVSQLAQRVHDAAPQAYIGFLPEAQLSGDAVRCTEADAPDVVSQPEGVLLHPGDALIPVLPVYPGGKGRAHAMLLQKEHDILHFLLPLPALRYHPDALVPDAWYLYQELDVVLYDREGIRAEPLDDFLRVLRPHALYQAAAQIFLHAVDGGGERLLPLCGHELTAVPGVHLPFPLHQEHGAHVRVQKVSHHGDQVVIALYIDFQDGIAVFRILVCNSLHDTSNRHRPFRSFPRERPPASIRRMKTFYHISLHLPTMELWNGSWN